MSQQSQGQPNTLLQRVQQEMHRNGLTRYLTEEPLVVGVSGGADSLTLLHLLYTVRGDHASRSLHVAHLNHWIRDREAREDAEFVRDIAAKWGLSSTIETFDVPNFARRHKLSSEDAARRVRYVFLSRLAAERGATVAVAHNADDQVETVLMSILRGTGVSGLAGMSPLGKIPEATSSSEAMSSLPGRTPDALIGLFRPLLAVWRHEIVDYCKSQGLEPRFDSTNWDRSYRRNRIRHDLLPLLQLQYSLAIKDHLYDLASIASGEDQLIEQIVEEAWTQVAVPQPDGAQFRMDEFANLPLGLMRRLARGAVLHAAGTLQDLTFDQIDRTVDILRGEEASTTAMHLPHDLIAGRQGEWSYIRRRSNTPSLQQERIRVSEWPLAEPGSRTVLAPGEEVALPHGWRLESTVSEIGEPKVTPGPLAALFDYDAVARMGDLVLRTRSPGDFIVPLGMKGHKRLQDLLVDAKIPRELRDHIALLAARDGVEVLWVPGRGGRRSAHAAITEATERVLQLRFYHDEPIEGADSARA
jgi:tRNA(Ile)-lysidine synthase